MNQMDFIQALKGNKICQFVLAITFLTSGLIINLVQSILYFGLRPISKHLFRKINYYVTYSLHCQVVFIAQYWANTRLTIYAKKSDYERYFGKEHGYVVMNHTYEIDWLVGWIFCDNIKVLGNTKCYGKKSLQYLPTLGWNWKFGESVFLERNWEKDREIIKKQIAELVTYPDPIWLLLAAEGTRFTETKYKLSRTFAEQNGLPVLKHHLTPRTKGFTYSLPCLKKNVNAIYNVILGFERNSVSPTIINVLMGKTLEASMYVERIPIDQVPEDEAEGAKWLHELYWKKDEMLDSFLETGSWFKKSGVEEVDRFLLPRRIFPFLNTIVWAVLVLSTIGYTMFRLLMSGSILYFLIGCSVIACFSLLLQNLIGQMQISKASSYGAR